MEIALVEKKNDFHNSNWRKKPPRLHRGNALPGDYLVSTGFHGLSRLGLALLTSEKLPSEVYNNSTAY